MSDKTSKSDFLFELWVEELPVSYIKSAITQIKTLAGEYFSANRLHPKMIESFGTPNRIILYAEDMPLANHREEKTIFGPPEKAVFDQNGEYTVQAAGFARKYNTSPGKIQIVEGKAALKIAVGGEKAKVLLSKIMPEIVSRLEFPKTMIWEESAFRFARPIRNILCLLGSETVNFRIAGVKTSNKTIGLHVTTSEKKIEARTPQAYFEKVRNLCVLIDPAERIKSVEKQSLQALKARRASLIKDDSLIESIAYITENPVAVLGEFKQEYLKLPKEALVCCMKDKQKFLCASDHKGDLLPLFVGFRNGSSEHQDIVKEGFERVLDARLSDVNFFYSKDVKTGLESKIEKLKKIIQNEKLGSLYDKTERIFKLSALLADRMGFSQEEKNNLQRAAMLSKADLASDMVFEYPELQGVMGGIYAKAAMEPEGVSSAVYEQYMPVSAESPAPGTKAGRMLALADKIDALSSSFILAYVPKGSGDPYGLRRMAYGILRIIFEGKLEFDLGNIVKESLKLFGGDLANNAGDAFTVEMEFIRQRLAVYFAGEGAEYDVVDAVLSSSYWPENIVDTKTKTEALKAVRTNPDFEPFILLFRRAANILNQAKDKKIEYSEDVNKNLIAEPEEKLLFEKCEELSRIYKGLLSARDYKRLFYELLAFKEPLNNIFDKVLVMAEDPELKKNRLSLIFKFKSYFDPLADFTKIVLNSEKPAE